MERWKPIDGYEGYYEVSNQGRVRSLPRVQKNKRGQVRNYGGKLLGEEGFGYADKFGYRSVILCTNEKQIRYKIHRLVCDVFIRPLSDDEVVMHLNDNPGDNRIENLRIGSQKENLHDCIQKGRFNSGAAQKARTRCPRGHLLQDDNLCVAGVKNGKRACLSCHRAHSKIYDAKRRQGVDLSDKFADFANSYYASTETAILDAIHPVAPTIANHIRQQIKEHA